MTLFTHYPRFHRVVFVMAIVALVTTFTSIIFVAADNQLETYAPASSRPSDTAVNAKIAERFGRLPLSFELNEGQIDPAVRFLSRGSGYDLFLTANEAVVSLRKPRELKSHKQRDPQPDAEPREGSVVRLKMIGANAAAHVEGRDELPGKVNYFSGNNPEKWRRNIPTFQKVYYKDVYPGIDIVYYGNQRELEYDFMVAPGANPKAIKFQIDGADRITLDKSGNLVLALQHGEVQLNKPFIYQLSENGARNEIKGEYAINGKQISFKVRGFDARKPLVIDPVLSYSTFLGSGGSDSAAGIAVDSQGSAYVTGFTDSSTFPTTSGAFKTTSTSGGAFITKLDPTGSSLVYSTYLSGGIASTTGASKIAIDAAGNAYVTGVTTASDFPLVNPLKTAGNFFKTSDSAANWNNLNTGLPFDVNVIAIAPNALQKVYAATPAGPYRSDDSGSTWTKLSTTGFPFASALSLAVSPVNSAVVWAGFSSGFFFKSVDGGASWNAQSLPVAGLSILTIVFDPSTPATMYLGTNGGVFRSIDSGSTWTALNNFTGLSSPPSVRAIAIDPTTPSTIYAGTLGSGLFKSTNGGANWSPINNGFSGSGNSFVTSIMIDPFNASTIYAADGFSSGIINKSTNAGSLWTPMNNGVPSATVTALVADRSTASTLYAATSGGIVKTVNGGTNWTNANVGLWNQNVTTMVAHPSNSAIMYAGASGANIHDAFVTKLNSTGSGLLFSTYLGGNFSDFGNGIAVDAAGKIYVVGETISRNFPTVNAIKPAPSATDCGNGFVTKIDPAIPGYVFSTYLGGSKCDSAFGVALDSAGDVYVTGNTTSSDFPTANAFQPNLADTFDGDAFVTKLATSGSLVYSTYLGGSQLETGRGIAVNSSGEAFITGNTRSLNFPTLNPIQGFDNFAGVEEVFVTKFNSQGSALVYSTYLGGDRDDFARGIAVDATGNAYVVGLTNSGNFPIVAGALRTRSTLFKTRDGGTTWSNDNYGINNAVNFSINNLIVHPTQTSTIYAGTNSGIFKSINGGRTWSAISNGLNETRVIELLMDPLTPSTLYAATGPFDSDNFGIYKSTDGGITWNLRKNGMNTTARLISLAIDPVTPGTLYAALNSNSGSSGGQLFKTTDGADNWVQTGNVPPTSFTSMAVDPHNHTTVYGGALASNAGLFRSVDGGVTWNPIGFSQTGSFGRFIGASPHTSGLLYAQFNQGVLKSTDGGDNWSLITSESGPIVFDPVSSSTVYLLSGSKGVLKSTDNGTTWVQLSKGFAGPQTTALAIDPLKTSTMYFATLPGGGEDSFVAKLNLAGSALIYSTFVGGMLSAGDFSGVSAQAQAIALDSAGNAYISGVAQSPGFATTPNSFQPLHRAFNDAFISKLTMSHLISGHVLDGSNAPVSGADVVLNDGTSLT